MLGQMKLGYIRLDQVRINFVSENFQHLKFFFQLSRLICMHRRTTFDEENLRRTKGSSVNYCTTNNRAAGPRASGVAASGEQLQNNLRMHA